jgi:signal transduction histidine kinase
MRQPSLLWRVLLVSSAATVVLFSATAYLIARYAIANTEQGVQDEVHASLREFEFIWRTRADSLARTSRLMSTMSDVRGAFQTGDAATIRDTAADLWARVSQEDAVFLVFDPMGRQIASLGGARPTGADSPSAAQFRSMGRVIPAKRGQFPAQAAGFVLEDGRLYYTILTPVYVDAGSGSALLNVLVTGFAINHRFARSLAEATEGSEFVFRAQGKTVASTLTGEIPSTGFAVLTDPLLDLDGQAVGQLSVMRSLAANSRRLAELKKRIAMILAVAIAIALAVSYALARRIIHPIYRLDQAAAEVSRRNYGFRLPIDRNDELGRLAGTFNAMCDSIQAARQELITQERLNTIGRLSSSIVHDLRNPLAAIYGGSEMLVDSENLQPQQAKRLALSIYRASRHIQEMLRDLADSARGKAEPIEVCRLFDVVDAARSLLAGAAETQGTSIAVDIPETFEMPLERSRMERVFLNLINNALEAQRSGGVVSIHATEADGSYLISVDDTGVGIPEEVREQLFLPFFSYGKRNGLGLGLALSRQTVLDHGGEMWIAEKDGPGARFWLRLKR